MFVSCLEHKTEFLDLKQSVARPGIWKEFYKQMKDFCLSRVIKRDI